MVARRLDGLAARGRELEDGFVAHISKLFDPCPDEPAGFLVQCLNFVSRFNVFYRDFVVDVGVIVVAGKG